MEVIGTCDTKRGIIFVQVWSDHIAPTLRNFETNMPEKGYGVSIHPSGVFSDRVFNSISIVLAVILPTLVSVACKFDNFKSLPFAWRSRRPDV